MLSTSDNKESSDVSRKEYETVSYVTTCEDITIIISGEKLPIGLKQEINNERKNHESIPVISDTRCPEWDHDRGYADH